MPLLFYIYEDKMSLVYKPSTYFTLNVPFLLSLPKNKENCLYVHFILHCLTVD